MSTMGDQNRGFENAAAALKPPADEMLLSPKIRELASLTASAHFSKEKLQSRLEGLVASRSAPTLHTMGGGVSPFAKLAGNFGSLTDMLSGLYEPSGSTSWNVPAERRYVLGQSWASPNGSAVASRGSGELYTVTRARLAGNNDHSDAGVYIRVPTPTPAYGQVNRLRFEPDISWNAQGQLDMDWEWARFAAGSVVVQGKLWLVAYEFNLATNLFEPLLNNSAINATVFHWTLSGSGSLPFTGSGHFPAGSLALECIVDPARSYLLGVVAQTQILHNLVHGDGPPHVLLEPAPGEFNTFAILNVVVPEMWISHAILA